MTRAIATVMAWAVFSLPARAGSGGTAEPKGFDDDYSRGMELVRSGKAEQGLELLKLSVTRASGANLDAAQTGLGAAYLALGKARDARAALKGPIDRSAYVPALIEMARTWLYGPPFEPKKAIGLLQTAIEREPKNVEAMLELARAYLNDGSVDSSIDLCEKLTEDVAPHDVRAWFALGDAQIRDKRFDKAKTAFRTAVRLAPKDPETYFRMGEMIMADEAERDHVQKAIGWYERAVDLGREVPKYYGALIYGYYRNGNNLAAAPVLARLETFAAGSSTTRWAKGVFSEYMGRTAEAFRLYQEAVALDRANVYAHYALGIITSGRRNSDFVMIGADRDWKYLPLRDVDKATAELKTALALAPAFPFAAKAHAVLEELAATPTEAPPDTPELREQRKKLDEYYKTKARLF